MSWKKVAKTIMAKNPMTTDGKAASISIMGLMISFLLWMQNRKCKPLPIWPKVPSNEYGNQGYLQSSNKQGNQSKTRIVGNGNPFRRERVLQVLSAPSLFPVTFSSMTTSSPNRNPNSNLGNGSVGFRSFRLGFFNRWIQILG